MKKIILSVGVAAVFLGYVAYVKSGSGANILGITEDKQATSSAFVSSETAGKKSVVGYSDDNRVRGDDDSEESDDDSASGVKTSAVTTIVSSQPVSSPSSTSTGGAISSGKYKDGRYVGTSVNVFYGNVQVAAIISGGRISDVQFLDYPKDRETSIQKSNMAMPILKSEAITAQSANVDAVSGATATSGGFVESLSNALVQAKI
jgi:uncharacterized protein with FMN-binding domain